MLNDSSATIRHFKRFILNSNYPCLMARSVVSQGHFRMGGYGVLGSEQNVKAILSDLKGYLESYNFDDNSFFTFIATFEEDQPLSEKEFETRLWNQLQLLHESDSEAWDDSVDANPDSNNFSFSLLGKAFYIVGLHPNSSRKARQAPSVSLVFNLHHQFEKLRELGAYESTRNTIRERDIALQGSINPMLKDFGHGKEAPQYSGRKVGSDWKCPFHSKISK